MDVVEQVGWCDGGEMSEETPVGTPEERFLYRLRKTWETYANAEEATRLRQLEYLRFYALEHWPTDIRARREAAFRPCLTEDHLTQMVKQVMNELRKNRPSIVVHPVDNGADVRTAEVLSGIMRHIQVASNASIAYDTANEAAIVHGRGYLRVVVDYVSPDSFMQEIRIQRIRNPFTVYMDPSCQQPDYSDAEGCFIVDEIPTEEYKRRFPKRKVSLTGGVQGSGDDSPTWFNGNSVRVAEYFYITHKEKKMALLTDGRVVEFSEDLDTKSIIKTRVALFPRVKWCLTNGYEILEGRDNDGRNPDDFLRDFPGKFIPVVPFLGEEQDVDGQIHLSGMVKAAMDPSRMLDYYVSAEAEAINLVPKSPWIMVEGQDEGYEEMWAAANIDNVSVLKYKSVDIEGKPAPAPQRVFGEPAIRAITQAKIGCIEGLKSATGVYDASLGAQGNETSGVAIERRQIQSSMGNFHYSENSARAIAHTGRVIMGIIPEVMDIEQVTRILGEDGTAKTVAINTTEPVEFDGIKQIFDVTTGKYDVVVEAGPSYATKRQESRDSIMAMTNAFPDMVPIVGDLLVKSMDWPGAQEIAARMRKMLPPQLQDQQGGPQIPPAVQQQMQEQAQMVEQLMGELQEAKSQLQSKQVEMQAKSEMEQTKTEAALHMSDAKIQAEMQLKQMELESQTAVAQAKLEAEIAIKQAEIESQERLEAARIQADMTKCHATLQSEEKQTAFQGKLKYLESKMRASGMVMDEEEPGAEDTCAKC